MTDNQQPFVPPLTAEERGLWDRVFVEAFRSYEPNTWLSCANYADGAITERRRRFGVAESRPGDAVASWPKWKQDALGPNPLADSGVHLGGVLPTCPHERPIDWLTQKSIEIDTLRAEAERLTKDVQVRENVYRIRCEQVDALVARAEKAEAELDAHKAHLNALRNFLDAPECKLPVGRVIGLVKDLRAELAEARPVLEAVVRWFSERAWTVKDSDTLRDYAMSQRAARAAKAQDATNNVDGGN